jgi:hypothetical protein
VCSAHVQQAGPAAACTRDAEGTAVCSVLCPCNQADLAAAFVCETETTAAATVLPRAALLLAACLMLHHDRQAVCSWYAIRSFSQMRSRRMYVSEPRCCTIAKSSAYMQQDPDIRTAHRVRVVSSHPERQGPQKATHFMHTGAWHQPSDQCTELLSAS